MHTSYRQPKPNALEILIVALQCNLVAVICSNLIINALSIIRETHSHNFTKHSARMQELMNLATLWEAFNSTILLTSVGTGKCAVARWMHTIARGQRPFIAL